MHPLERARHKGAAVLLAVLLACLPCAAGEITNPSDCEKLPGQASSLCKREFQRTGSFAFARLTRAQECQKLRDSSLHGPCRDAISSNGAFYASTAPRPNLSMPATSPSSSASESAHAGAILSASAEEEPRTLEERNTQALETIATYTQVQAIVSSTLVGIGVVGLLVALLAN